MYFKRTMTFLNIILGFRISDFRESELFRINFRIFGLFRIRAKNPRIDNPDLCLLLTLSICNQARAHRAVSMLTLRHPLRSWLAGWLLQVQEFIISLELLDSSSSFSVAGSEPHLEIFLQI